jgi:hypothetical protein
MTPIQPLWVPPNVEFVVDDCEKDWLTRDVDLAHFRFMAMILRVISGVLGHAYQLVTQAYTIPVPLLVPFSGLVFCSV